MRRSFINLVCNPLKGFLIIVTTVILFTPQLPVNAGEGIIVTGLVDNSILDNGDIVSVKLDSRPETDVVFNVVLNAMGLKLGKEMRGYLVEVIGSVRIEDEVNWLEVKRYEKVELFE